MELLSTIIGLSFIISMNLPIIAFSIYCAELSRAHSQRQFSSYFHQSVPQ